MSEGTTREIHNQDTVEDLNKIDPRTEEIDKLEVTDDTEPTNDPSTDFRSPDYKEVVEPEDENHEAINYQYGDLLKPQNDRNLNRKYDLYFKLIPDVFVGEGIKKTPAYVSKISSERLHKKRDEFWSNAR